MGLVLTINDTRTVFCKSRITAHNGVVGSLRLTSEKHVCFGFHNYARARNLSDDALDRIRPALLDKISDTRSSERPDALVDGPTQYRIFHP